MKCPLSSSVVRFQTPQLDGVKTAQCEECGAMVKMYLHSDKLTYRVGWHSIPDEPLLCDNEWIAHDLLS